MKYSKKDALIAICVVLLVIPLMALRPIAAILPIDWHAVPIYIALIVAWPLEKVIITIVPVTIIILVMKQGFASVGIHKENLWKAVCLGFIVSLIPIFWGILPIILYGGEFAGFGLFTALLIRTFIMAIAEDVVFVGYLQTRLYGIFKSDIAAISVGAAFFSFMHVPMWLRTGLLNFDDLLSFGFMVILWFIMHFVLVALYRRYNSLIAVTIFHTLANFMVSPYMIWIFADEYVGYAGAWAQTSGLFIPVAVGIWVLVRYLRWRRSKKLVKPYQAKRAKTRNHQR